MHLAQLNIGRLVADTDDPRVSDFMAALDRVNGLGKRMPGFVWMMEGESGAGNTEAKIAGDSRFISNLTSGSQLRRWSALSGARSTGSFTSVGRSGSSCWGGCTS
jgi:hypothetical protein